MQFEETDIPGVFVIHPKVNDDERGSFTRLFDRQIFEERGLSTALFQTAVSVSKTTGTLRGMHSQAPPFAETKLIRCPRGRVYDVVVDLRRESPTFCQWTSIELSDENGKMIFVPEGCGHGFLTLEGNSHVLYHISAPYAPEHERGVLWNDPSFAIQWPMNPTILSEKDRSHRLFNPTHDGY